MILEVTGLTKRYGNVTALDRIDFTLSGRGIIGFVGANGAGKTTALRIMSGLEEPDAGDVKLDGVSIVDYPDKVRRKIGFMPDTLPDASDITVKEYLNFFVNSFAEKYERESVMREVVEFTGVDGFLNRKLGDLSKGMKQRVSLARAFLNDAPVLLLDEPTKELDEEKVKRVIERISEEGKHRLVILVTHEFSDIEAVGAEIISLSRESKI